MTTENRILDISLPAAEDLSDYQYHFVVLTSSGTVRLPDSEGELSIGILQNAPESGEAAVVRVAGISKLVANDAIVIGTHVMPEYVGATDAGKGDDAVSYPGKARAVVIEASDAEDDLCSVLLYPQKPSGTFAVSEITLASAKIIVGSGGGVGGAVDMSGDATIDNAGAVTIAAGAILTAKISSSQVTTTKLASAAISEYVSAGASSVTSHVTSSAH